MAARNELTPASPEPRREPIRWGSAQSEGRRSDGLQDLDPEAVMKRLFDHVRDLAGVDAGIVFGRDGQDNLAVRWCHEVDGSLLAELVALNPQGPALVRRCASRHQTEMWPNPGSNDPDRWLEVLGWRHAIAVPMLDQQIGTGVFLAGWLTPTRLNPEGLSVIEASAAHAASALHRARLFQELKREEHRLRGLLEALPVPALLINRDSQIVIWLNDRARALLGNIQGTSYQKLAERHLDAEIQDEPDLSSKGELHDFGRIQIKAADHSLRTVEVTTATIGPTESLIVLHDITIDIRVEQTRARFLRMLSHHLRTPLTPLVGYAALLEDHLPSSGDALVREATSAIKETLDAMMIQVERLEQAASLRIATPRSHRPITAKDLIMNAWKGPEADLIIDGEASITLNCAVDHAIAGLKEILDNALIHGIPPVTATVIRRGDKTQIRITDNGAGIPPEWAEGIFTPYVSAAEGYEAAPAGHFGLGLTVARLHIEAALGTLTYDPTQRAFVMTV